MAQMGPALLRGLEGDFKSVKGANHLERHVDSGEFFVAKTIFVHLKNVLVVILRVVVKKREAARPRLVAKIDCHDIARVARPLFSRIALSQRIHRVAYDQICSLEEGGKIGLVQNVVDFVLTVSAVDHGCTTLGSEPVAETSVWVLLTDCCYLDSVDDGLATGLKGNEPDDRLQGLKGT